MALFGVHGSLKGCHTIARFGWSGCSEYLGISPEYSWDNRKVFGTMVPPNVSQYLPNIPGIFGDIGRFGDVHQVRDIPTCKTNLNCLEVKFAGPFAQISQIFPSNISRIKILNIREYSLECCSEPPEYSDYIGYIWVNTTPVDTPVKYHSFICFGLIGINNIAFQILNS